MKIISLFFFFISTSVYSQQIITVGAKKPITKVIEDTLNLPASVLANESVKITSVVSEKIKNISFEEGKFVKKGQLLVELVDLEEKAVLKQFNAELDEANLNFERAKKLISKGNISQSILDNRVMIRKKLIAKIEEIKAKIEDLKIRAPFDGITSVRNFSEGSFIKPGDIITELYDTKTLKIQAFVPESFMLKLKDNSKFSVTSDLIKDLNISGKVSVIDPLIDTKTRTFKILGKVANKKNIIKPGMMVKLKVLFEKRDSLLIRENSVFNQDDVSFIYLVNQNKIIEKKQIKVGLKFDGMIEVIDGIKTNDLIVYEGINKIKNGVEVKIK
tara:strand:+ start:282 stop:1271 length:990 start_codon:yes stop_codon:yes gene_type:complete